MTCAPLSGSVNNSGGEIVVLEISTTSILETGSKRHQTAVRRNPCDANPVVRFRSDDTGDVCSVSRFIFGVVIADCPITAAGKRRRVAEIPSISVVNVAVSVIVQRRFSESHRRFPKSCERNSGCRDAIPLSTTATVTWGFPCSISHACSIFRTDRFH